VDFAVKPRAGEGPNATPEGDFPMEVQPAQLDIPPHEHRYVTVYFAPRSIATFQAVFEATVQARGVLLSASSRPTVHEILLLCLLLLLLHLLLLLFTLLLRCILLLLRALYEHSHSR
jgi:hypothetical protein